MEKMFLNHVSRMNNSGDFSLMTLWDIYWGKNISTEKARGRGQGSLAVFWLIIFHFLTCSLQLISSFTVFYISFFSSPVLTFLYFLFCPLLLTPLFSFPIVPFMFFSFHLFHFHYFSLAFSFPHFFLLFLSFFIFCCFHSFISFYLLVFPFFFFLFCYTIAIRTMGLHFHLSLKPGSDCMDYSITNVGISIWTISKITAGHITNPTLKKRLLTHIMQILHSHLVKVTIWSDAT